MDGVIISSARWQFAGNANHRFFIAADLHRGSRAVASQERPSPQVGCGTWRSRLRDRARRPCLPNRIPRSCASRRGCRIQPCAASCTPLAKNRHLESIVARPFLREPRRCDRDQGERGSREHIPDGMAEFRGSRELPFRAFRNEAQIHIAVRPRFAARLRADEPHFAQRQRGVHRFETLAQGLALRGEAGGKIFEEQLHGASR